MIVSRRPRRPRISAVLSSRRLLHSQKLHIEDASLPALSPKDSDFFSATVSRCKDLKSLAHLLSSCTGALPKSVIHTRICFVLRHALLLPPSCSSVQGTSKFLTGIASLVAQPPLPARALALTALSLSVTSRHISSCPTALCLSTKGLPAAATVALGSCEMDTASPPQVRWAITTAAAAALRCHWTPLVTTHFDHPARSAAALRQIRAYPPSVRSQFRPLPASEAAAAAAVACTFWALWATVAAASLPYLTPTDVSKVAILSSSKHAVGDARASRGAVALAASQLAGTTSAAVGTCRALLLGSVRMQPLSSEGVSSREHGVIVGGRGTDGERSHVSSTHLPFGCSFAIRIASPSFPLAASAASASALGSLHCALAGLVGTLTTDAVVVVAKACAEGGRVEAMIAAVKEAATRIGPLRAALLQRAHAMHASHSLTEEGRRGREGERHGVVSGGRGRRKIRVPAQLRARIAKRLAGRAIVSMTKPTTAVQPSEVVDKIEDVAGATAHPFSSSRSEVGRDRDARVEVDLPARTAAYDVAISLITALATIRTTPHLVAKVYADAALAASLGGLFAAVVDCCGIVRESLPSAVRCRLTPRAAASVIVAVFECAVREGGMIAATSAHAKLWRDANAAVAEHFDTFSLTTLTPVAMSLAALPGASISTTHALISAVAASSTAVCKDGYTLDSCAVWGEGGAAAVVCEAVHAAAILAGDAPARRSALQNVCLSLAVGLIRLTQSGIVEAAASIVSGRAALQQSCSSDGSSADGGELDEDLAAAVTTAAVEGTKRVLVPLSPAAGHLVWAGVMLGGSAEMVVNALVAARTFALEVLCASGSVHVARLRRKKPFTVPAVPPTDTTAAAVLCVRVAMEYPSAATYVKDVASGWRCATYAAEAQKAEGGSLEVRSGDRADATYTVSSTQCGSVAVVGDDGGGAAAAALCAALEGWDYATLFSAADAARSGRRSVPAPSRDASVENSIVKRWVSVPPLAAPVPLVALYPPTSHSPSSPPSMSGHAGDSHHVEAHRSDAHLRAIVSVPRSLMLTSPPVPSGVAIAHAAYIEHAIGVPVVLVPADAIADAVEAQRRLRMGGRSAEAAAVALTVLRDCAAAAAAGASARASYDSLSALQAAHVAARPESSMIENDVAAESCM